VLQGTFRADATAADPPDADAGASRVVLAIGYRYWLSRIVLAQELN
jgi:hypothetical protein